MSVTMFDSSDPAEIPSSARYVAAYVNGYVWPAAQVRRFPRVIRISVLPEAYWARMARVIDVESGAASPADARSFIIERQRLGFHDATVYCNLSNRAAVQEACHGLEYREWIASWTGAPHQIDNAWAVQFESTPGYDESEVYGVLDFSKT